MWQFFGKISETFGFLLLVHLSACKFTRETFFRKRFNSAPEFPESYWVESSGWAQPAFEEPAQHHKINELLISCFQNNLFFHKIFVPIWQVLCTLLFMFKIICQSGGSILCPPADSVSLFPFRELSSISNFIDQQWEKSEPQNKAMLCF